MHALFTNMQRDFCALTSVSLAESRFATTPTMNRFLLIEYAYPWEEHPLEESTIISEEVKQFLNDCIDNQYFSRIFLVKNQQSTRDQIRVFLVNNREEDPFTTHIQLTTYQDLLSIDFQQAFWDEQDRLPEPMYLVCTHGKVDMCCAKFGLPILKRLLELGADVWQCSHVTGDRFAPNVVQVPYGHYYGHLQVDEMATLYQTLQQGQIYFSKYRGRSCHTKPEQAADYFLRKHLNDFDVDSLKLVKNDVLTDSTQAFTFYHRDQDMQYTLVVKTTQSEPVYVMNCKATEKKPVDIFTLESLTESTPRIIEAKPSRYHYTQWA